MAVKKEKFDNSKIQVIRDYLADQQQDGNPRPFEIFVDELKVVSKTEDMTRFDNYEKYLRPDTLFVLFKLYHNSSPNNDQYYYYLREEASEPVGLSGVDKIVNQRLNEREKEYQVERLNLELDNVKQELQDSEAYNEELQERVTQLQTELTEQKSKPGLINRMNLGEIAASTIETLVQRNPTWVTNTPLGRTLAGIGATNNEKVEATEETEAGFKKKEELPALNREEREIYELVRRMSQKMDGTQLMHLAKILTILAEQPQHLSTIEAFLNEQQ
jgi:hypothetical protein